ncbi:MAG: histidine phosphatase family protein [Candidatus Woesearchaeota archaeon]
MKLILIRHGQTEYNAQKIHQPFDSDLSELGREQAKNLCSFFDTYTFDTLFVSEMKRTSQTASQFTTMKPIVDGRLNEIFSGDFVGTPYGTVRKEGEKVGKDFYSYQPPNGTSPKMVYEAVSDWYEEIKKTYAQKTVVAVTHKGVIKLLLAHVKRDNPADELDIPIRNCSLTIIEDDAVIKVNFVVK